MKIRLFPTLILLTLAPLAARANEPLPAQADETTATTAEDLPYGAGYEARERLAQGEQMAAPDQARAQQAEAAHAEERDRREAREQRGQRGPTRQ